MNKLASDPQRRVDTIHSHTMFFALVRLFSRAFTHPYKMCYPQLKDPRSRLYILASSLDGRNTGLIPILSSVSDYDFD